MFRKTRSAVGSSKGSSKLKIDKRKSQVLGIGIALILILQVTGPLVPLPASFAIPPLPAVQPTSVTKTYAANHLGTQVQTAVTFGAELNGTIIFSRDGTERFRIFTPRGLTGSTTLLTNETHAIVDVSSGSFFIQEKWKLDAQKFKMELCWSLPSASIVTLPLSRMDRFDGRIFVINGLEFDWRDALQAGFSVSYVNATKSISVSVSASGCLDPQVGETSISNPIVRDAVASFGNDWYVSYANSSHWVAKCSVGGGSFSTATNLKTWEGGNHEPAYGTWQNSTHGFWYMGGNIAGSSNQYGRVKTGASCGAPEVSLDTISGEDRPTFDVTGNGTHLFFLDAVADDGVRLFRCNTLGSQCSDRGYVFSGDCCLNWVYAYNLTAGNIIMVESRYTVAGLRHRIYHANGDQTFGTLTTITSDTLASYYSWSCLSGTGVLYCIWLTNTGILKFSKFDGASWSSATTVAYPGSIDTMIGITKANGDNTLMILRLSGTSIKWNKTNSAGTSFVDTGSISIGSQTSPNYMAVSIRPNATGHVGIAWMYGSSSPYNINFTTFQAFPPSGATWGTDIAVMNSADHEREPHAVASTKSNTLVAVAIDGDGNGARCETRASTDGGDSWGNANTIPKNLTNSRQGDPAIATNSTGGFIMVCLELGNPSTSDSAKERIYTYSSKDGINWSFQKMIKSDDSTAILLDKPWLVIDSNSTAGHPYKDYVYVCWTQFHRDPSTEQNLYTQMMFKRILPTPLQEKVLFNATFTHGSQIGCNMAIGTNGEVYVPWFNYGLGGPLNAMLQFRWNELGGEDWGWGRIQNVTSFKRSLKYHADCLPNNKWDCLKGEGTSAIRVGFMPGLAVDMKGGVHIVYAENRTGGTNGQGDIRYVNSDDCRRGSSVDRCSWNTPITINLDTSNKDQFVPTIHVSNITSGSAPRGTVYVTALDRRDASSNIDWMVWSYICAPGATLGCRNTSEWSNTVVSDLPINNHDLSFIGD